MSDVCPATGNRANGSSGCPFSVINIKRSVNASPWWLKTAVMGGVIGCLSLQVYKLLWQAKKIKRGTYKHVIYHDIVYPPFMVPSAVDDMRQNFVLRDDDVVIATYPKCGTTWMQQIVLLLLNTSSPEFHPDPMAQSPWLEMATSLHAADPTGKIGKSIADWNAMDKNKRRCLKTHAPEHLVPWVHSGSAVTGITKGAKVIVVCRNSFDAAVSMFHHSIDVPAFGYNGDWNDMFERFKTGQIEHGSYWEWYEGWYPTYHANQDSVLWINFEDIKANPMGEIRRVANFLDMQCDDDTIKGIADGSSFATMKKQFEIADADKLKKGLKVKKNHIRQGKVGGWKGYFSEEQKEVFLQRQKSYAAAVPTSVEIKI